MNLVDTLIDVSMMSLIVDRKIRKFAVNVKKFSKKHKKNKKNKLTHEIRLLHDVCTKTGARYILDIHALNIKMKTQVDSINHILIQCYLIDSANSDNLENEGWEIQEMIESIHTVLNDFKKILENT